MKNNISLPWSLRTTDEKWIKYQTKFFKEDNRRQVLKKDLAGSTFEMRPLTFAMHP